MLKAEKILKYFTVSQYFHLSPATWESYKNLSFRKVPTIDEADFLLLTGGSDISSYIYGEEPVPGGTRGVDYERDIEEIHAVGVARVFNIPQVGICRGMQLLHALSGGKLIQHIDGHVGGNHKMINAKTKKFISEVNSLHHQALPISQAISMYGVDNITLSEDEKAVESFVDTKRNSMGVQYHPEYTSCPETARHFFFDMLIENI